VKTLTRFFMKKVTIREEIMMLSLLCVIDLTLYHSPA